MTPLSALAPDQRAVLELLLRQGRSYAELSDLLGIPEVGVRSRAAAALAALAPDRHAPIGEDGAVADWILGQQDEAEAARTREALARTPAWRAWAIDVTDTLAEVDGAEVPDVPDAEEDESPAPAAAPAKPARQRGDRQRRGGERGGAAGRGGSGGAAGRGRGRGGAGGRADRGGAGTPPSAAREGGRARPVREAAAAGAGAGAGAAATATAKPPRRPAAPAGEPIAPGAGGGAAGLRSSKLGGAIVLGVAVVLIAGFLIWFLSRGGGSNSPASASTTPTPTATATPQVVSEIPLTGVGNKAQGLMRVFRRQSDGALVFALAADKVPQNKAREVYAVWFTKKGKAPLNLGFSRTQVGKDNLFQTGGPQAGKEAAFAQQLVSYDTVIVARASASGAGAKSPGQVVLTGKLPTAQG